MSRAAGLAGPYVAWVALAVTAAAQEPPPEPTPAPEAPAPAAAPAPPAGAPDLAEATRYASPTWGLELPLPRGATLDEAVPSWAVLTWKLPYGADGFGFLSVGFSEPGESPRAYRRFLERTFEENGFIRASEPPPPGLPAEVATEVVFRRTADGEVRRLVFWLQPSWSAALVFAHPAATERDWAAFVRAMLATTRVVAPARGLSARLGAAQLAAPALEATLGVTMRLPKGAVAAPTGGHRHLLAWELPLAPGRVARIGVVRGDDGETTASVLAAFARGGVMGSRLSAMDDAPDALRGTTGRLVMDDPERRLVWQLAFLEQGGHVWWMNLGCDAASLPLLRPMMTRMLLGFRATATGDPRLVAPEGPVHETPDVTVQTEPKQVPARALKECATTVQATLEAARALWGGPPPTGRVRVHCYTPDEMVRRAGKAAAATLPLAAYLPEGRCILAQVAGGKTSERLTAELQRAAGAAYRDGWLGTPHAIPPWLLAGTEELLRAPRGPGNPPGPDATRAPLADWVRKNRKSATWPAIETFVRARRPLGADADRAYALALVAVAVRGDTPRDRDLCARWGRRLLERGDPDELLEDLLDGLDLAAWDAAARAWLAALS